MPSVPFLLSAAASDKHAIHTERAHPSPILVSGSCRSTVVQFDPTPSSSCFQLSLLPTLGIAFALHCHRQTMKDEYKRRRKLEHPLIRTLPDVDLTNVFAPVYQESLDIDCIDAFFIATQGQEFIAISSDEWWLAVYGLCNESSTASFDRGSVSEISDDAVIPSKGRKALWRAAPRDPEVNSLANIIFLAPDVLGLVQLEIIPATVSTWNVRYGQMLESIVLRGEYRHQTMCKISNTEFVVGGEHGHLFSFEHERGYNLRETGRIWKAHSDLISSISFQNGTILTTSMDATARLWDAETKKRLATLYHDEMVYGSAMSDQYIVTCSRYHQNDWENSELRIYRNSGAYPLAKIVRPCGRMFAPTLLNDGRVLCILRGYRDEDGRSVARNTLAVVDFENEHILAQLKVGCRTIVWYEVLSDGRLVVVGHGGCRGVIVTLPRRFARLISPKTIEKQFEIRRRRMCVLM